MFSKSASDLAAGDRVFLEGQFWTVGYSTFVAVDTWECGLENAARERKVVRYPAGTEVTVAEEGD